MNSYAMASHVCYYCAEEFIKLQDCINHLVADHQNLRLKYKLRKYSEITGKYGLQTKDFGITPVEVLKPGDCFIVQEESQTLNIEHTPPDKDETKIALSELERSTHNLSIDNECLIPNCENDNDDVGELEQSLGNLSLDDDIGVQSPIHKRLKTSTPHKKPEDDIGSYVEELRTLVPDVALEMQKHGCMQTWLEFHRMIKDGLFPLDNISFNLFLDVCRYYASDNTSEVRYSETVKRFWRIGYKLFHGKFLKFMSGPKHSGTVLTNEIEKGEFRPLKGSINFAVPIKSIKSGKFAPVSAENLQPGILHHLLDKIAESVTLEKTYKLCLDGKKINAATSGKLGDIDLWGYEHSPSLSQRKEKLEVDKKEISNLFSMVAHHLENGKLSTGQLTYEEKKILAYQLLQIVSILSERLRNLRELLIKKESAKEKLMSQSGDDWKKSKLAFVISSIITSVYDMKSCIRDLLTVNDKICNVIASLNGVKYASTDTVNLSEVSGYMHITGESSIPRFMKQRSEAWFERRKSALITGSTLYDALGLRSLKQQTAHFDEVLLHISKPEPSEKVKEMMSHGSKNEIHATATIIAKVLPVLNPKLKLFEEGCYPFNVNNVPIVVSPDGSCRLEVDSEAEYGIEIKCPYPGNKFATPVQYKIPQHYIPQVLSEMKALDTKHLYFVSYSEESSAVHEIEYDELLWSEIEKEVFKIYGSERPRRPTKKSESVEGIRNMLSAFTETNARFLMEVPSVKAVDCITSPEESPPGEIYCGKHKDTIPFSKNNVELQQIHELLYNAEVFLERAYLLTKQKASEFLGFMISDLDRFYHPENVHSLPVAYGMKGYSLPNSTLRIMINDVLKECSLRGIYVPVCSFDGQWCRLVTREKNDLPLTVLQLQKDVFAEAKKRSKSELVSRIARSNIIHVTSFRDLQLVAEVNWIMRLNQTKGCVERLLNVGSIKDYFVYKMSRRTFLLIKNGEAVNVSEDEQEINADDNILNTVSDNVLDQVSTDTAEQITTLSHTRNHEQTHPKSHEARDLSDETNETENSMEIDLVEDRSRNEVSEQVELLDEEDWNRMLMALKESEKGKNKNKWNISVLDFKSKFANAEVMQKTFLAKELNICVREILGKLRANNIKLNLSASKHETVNKLSKAIGDGSALMVKGRKRRNVPTLKALSKDVLKKTKKDYLNIIEAENMFPLKLREWYRDHPFGRQINISALDCPDQTMWYSRPEMNYDVGYYVFMILDAYHQICGARRLFCLKGIPSAGINNAYVHKIAEESEYNKCGLRSAMVMEPMLDRQNIAYAVATFSCEVQQALLNIGAVNEAQFCELIRNWYRAEDEPSIPAIQRCEYRLALRKWLLHDVNFGMFPPYGAYVKDIPIVLYEGLLTSIERRLQLFPLTKRGNYNVRSIGSLDIENFFGGFQDLDPWGTGVLRPDGIASALSVAVELVDARMNPERGFHMLTSSAKVYPCHSYVKNTEQVPIQQEAEAVIDLSVIHAKNHDFDEDERSRGKRKRKLGNISQPEDPVRRPTTIREYHKAHEAKILPHVRRGLNIQS